MDRRSLDTQRNVTMDVAKGIAIILVIFDHINRIIVLGNAISSFCVAFFIMLSGYFYKEQAIKEVVNKRFRGLMLPYLKNGLFVIIFLCAKDLVLSLETVGKAVQSAGGRVWNLLIGRDVYVIYFLLALFNVTLLFSLLQKHLYKKGMEVWFYIANILVTILGYGLIRRASFVPWYWDLACIMLVFYTAGWLWRRWEKKIPKWMKMVLWPLCLLTWIWGNYQGYIMVPGIRYYNQFPIYMVTAMAGCFVFLALSALISQIPWMNKGFAYCGRNSLKLLCINSFVVQILDWRRLLASESLPLLFVSQLMFSILCCIIWNGLEQKTRGADGGTT